LDVVRKADANLKVGSKDRNRLDKVLSFYGAEGQKNGVNVNFAKLDGAVGQTSTSSFLGTGLFKTTTITFDTKALTDFGDAGKGESVAHEGTHGVDQRANGMGSTRFENMDTEYHAFQSEAAVDRGLGVATESDGDRPVWAPGMSEADSVHAMRENARDATDLDCKEDGCSE
jgi:hypothetical protein